MTLPREYEEYIDRKIREHERRFHRQPHSRKLVKLDVIRYEEYIDRKIREAVEKAHFLFNAMLKEDQGKD